MNSSHLFVQFGFIIFLFYFGLWSGVTEMDKSHSTGRGFADFVECCHANHLIPNAVYFRMRSTLPSRVRRWRFWAALWLYHVSRKGFMRKLLQDAGKTAQDMDKEMGCLSLQSAAGNIWSFFIITFRWKLNYTIPINIQAGNVPHFLAFLKKNNNTFTNIIKWFLKIKLTGIFNGKVFIIKKITKQRALWNLTTNIQ